MKTGIAALTLVLGLALGTIIGLLLGGDDGTRAELTATQTQLELRDAQLAEQRQQVEGAERARLDAERQLEELLASIDSVDSEAMAELDAAYAEVSRLEQELLQANDAAATSAGEATSYFFVLEEMFAFAQLGFDASQYSIDPAVEDGLAELSSDLAASVRSVLTESDPLVAEAAFWPLLQDVLNALHAVATG